MGCGKGNAAIPKKQPVSNPSSVPYVDPLENVLEIKIQTNSCPHITVRIFDENIEALLDSGAGISVTNSKQLFEQHGLKILPSPIKICTADKTKYSCVGYTNLPITFRGITKTISVVIVPEISRKLILGVNFWKAFKIKPMMQGMNGLEEIAEIGQIETTTELFHFFMHPIETLPAIGLSSPDRTLDIPELDLPETSKVTAETMEIEHELNEDDRKELEKIIKTFPCTTENRLGRTTLLEHEIILREDAKPRRQPIYKCSPTIQAEMDREIERYKKLDAIEECSSEWANPLVPVRKSNGKLRVCLDSRRINALTKKDSYPMRDMRGIFHRLGSAKFFSVIDLKDAYFQIPLKEESRDYTAFRTATGLYRFKVCPFGLTNAPFSMCRLMDKVIGFDLEPYVFVYLDDIVVATKTLAEHLRLLKLVAERLRKANLTISLDKSRFCRKQVSYLGYLLTEKGVAIDSSRIEPILNYTRPKSVKDIRRLLGLAGFYQKFIQNYSKIAAPISDLLKKNPKKFVWTEAAEEAFQNLKSALISAPILTNPDFSCPFIIESDASDNAVGAALVQKIDGVTRVVAYFSKKLSSTQRKYASVEKECLGVLMAIEHFRHFVEGTKFKVVTDARSLLWLFTIGIESGNSKLLRWALKLQSYDIELEYRKGKLNVTADCLSRSLDAISTMDPDYEDLIKQISRDPQSFPDFRVIDNRVYKLVKNQGKVEDTRFLWKQYLPSFEREGAIKATHDKAHLGFDKTWASIRERFYWPRMSSEIKTYCRKCLTCQTSKASNTNTTAPILTQKKTAEYPWQFLTMDYVGPLPVSGKGRSTCLLVITDIFSKFILVQPFRQATADSLVPFVENMVFQLFGVPEVILTDNGTQFLAKSFQDLLEHYNVTHWRTPNYHPQVNDAERVNRVLTTAIRASIKKDHKDWANNVQTIACAIRNSVHEATHYSPYFVMFGRNMVSDGREYRHLRDNVEGNESANVEKEKLYADIRENLKKAFEKHSRYYNLRANSNCPTFTLGEKLLKKNTELSDKGKGYCAKLAPKYIPAVVKRKVGEHCYELEDEKGKRLGVYNCRYLKKLNSSS